MGLQFPVSRTTLLQFASISDAAAATSSKLAKQSALAEYFQALNDDDLRLAIRYAAGRAFPATQERTLNVGWASVSDVILSLLAIPPEEYHRQVIQSGEIGEALARLWPPNSNNDESLTLASINDAFDQLAATGVIESKRAILKDLFSRCHDPREAAYLAKIIFRDMRTGVQEGVLQASVARAFDKPLSSIQQCQLLVGDLEEVAILARRNAVGSARFQLFHPIQFMLATAQETPELAAKTIDGQLFYVQDKLDGIRAQVHKSGNRIAIYTRTMDRADESFPDVLESLSRIPGDFLLDGEIVPFCDGCVLPFAHIQKRLGRKTLTARILKENPAIFIAFDLLYRDGELLLDQPLNMRSTALELLACGGQLRTIDTAFASTAQEIASAFNNARARRNEGIVLKDPNSPYSPGRRGKAWLKLKSHLPTLDCVVTAAEYGHGKRKDWLSDYTFAVWDRDPSDPAAQLVNIGKAFTGLTEGEILQLTDLFHQLSIRQYGHVHLVQPKVVLEIACDQIQKSARHSSGYAMRFPRIKRIRGDKLPKDADRLDKVIDIFSSPANTAHNPTAAPTPKSKQLNLFE